MAKNREELTFFIKTAFDLILVSHTVKTQKFKLYFGNETGLDRKLVQTSSEA